MQDMESECRARGRGRVPYPYAADKEIQTRLVRFSVVIHSESMVHLFIQPHNSISLLRIKSIISFVG